MSSPLDKLQDYTVYGVCAIEVELDVLTGTHQLRRADLIEDTGISISPDIDVGQVLYIIAIQQFIAYYYYPGPVY